MRLLINRAVFILAVFFMPLHLNSQVIIMDETYSGTELLAVPGVSLPTRPAIISGASIRFEAGSQRHEVLLRLPLISAGQLAAGTSVNLQFDVTTTRRSSDSDLFTLVGDGLVLTGTQTFDNTNGGGGGIAFLMDPPTTAPVPDESVDLFINAPLPPIGGNFEASSQVCAGGMGTGVTLSFNSSSGGIHLATELDQTRELSLVFLAADFWELYQIDNVRIRIAEDQDCSVVPVALTDFSIE